ncbi:ribose-phosphate pyrophosphokinase [Chitinivorax sp. PXF-14]|uniref:ribose-phosphate pyrophosphokinase n=1 Tax=Chitinivorax sp. PXF-14 TaxID=3230488 RepID=UPI003466F709
MKPLILPLFGHDALAASIASGLDAEMGSVSLRHFPDGESHVRLDSNVVQREVIAVANLHDPDAKLAPLLFAADAARELGANRVGLIAPYLPYMRQDTRFAPGEAISSRSFARVLSGTVDWLLTIDPHLHRFNALDELYTRPNRVVHAAPLLSAWIAANVASPLLIGPDAESRQWVAEVAAGAGAPFLVLDKVRHGDRDVAVSVPEVAQWRGHTPVLVDDIISTGRTMIETIDHLRAAGMKAPVCLGVHAVFAGDAHAALMAAGAAAVLSCNSIPHASNRLDVSASLVQAARAMLA